MDEVENNSEEKNIESSEKKEERISDKLGNDFTQKLRENPWIISTIVLGVLVVFMLFSNTSITGNSISEGKAQEILNNFFEDNVPEDVVIKDISVESGLYKAMVEYQGSEIPVYLTQDGKSLASLQVLPSENSEDSLTQTEEITKTDKPQVEIFVMSFCPYGIQGEKLLKPVYDLLKDNVDFKIRFFATPQGDTIEEVRSLHGNLEAQEDARQVCIDKYYSDDKLWDYVYEIANTCPTAYNDEETLDSCWKAAAEKIGISVDRINDCYNNEVEMILDRFREDGELVNEYGLSGSESIVVNGVKLYAGDYRWSPDKTKDLICQGFNKAPEECSTDLGSGSEGSVQGSC